MAFDLVADSGVTFTTSAVRFGSAALNAAAVAHAVAIMPTNRTFRVRVSATMGGGSETRVVASAAAMFWLGKVSSGFARAEVTGLESGLVEWPDGSSFAVASPEGTNATALSLGASSLSATSRRPCANFRARRERRQGPVAAGSPRSRSTCSAEHGRRDAAPC